MDPSCVGDHRWLVKYKYQIIDERMNEAKSISQRECENFEPGTIFSFEDILYRPSKSLFNRMKLTYYLSFHQTLKSGPTNT